MLKMLSLFAFSCLWPFTASAAELDGTQWKMRFKGMPQALVFWRTDTLKFDNGQFVSKESLPYGFQGSSYQAHQDENATTWSATQANEKGEKAQWEGTRVGEKMEGTFTWIKADGNSKKFRWKAKARKP